MYDVVSGGRDGQEMCTDSFGTLTGALNHARALSKRLNDWVDIWAPGRYLGTVYQGGQVDWSNHTTPAEQEQVMEDAES